VSFGCIMSLLQALVFLAQHRAIAQFQRTCAATAEVSVLTECCRLALPCSALMLTAQ
jgi:hypothetical protein